MRNSSTSNSRRARSTTANLRPGLSAVKSSHYIPCDYGRKCNHKFAGVTTYYKHVEKYHFEEREARTAAKDKEREKLRMEEVESRTQRAANIEKEHIDSLAQYQEDPAAYFPRNPEANQPPARKEFFQWKVRRSIDLDDIQSDEDIEDEEDPVQYRDIPGTLPNLVRRLNLQTTYLSASDGESGSENDGQASAAKQSRGHEHTKLNNPASGYQHWEEFFVTKRVINKDVGNQERWGDVADDKKLFDLTGMDKTRGPFSPFQSASEFKKARWLIRHRASCEMITDGFNEGIMNCSCSCACGNDKKGSKPEFNSVYKMRQLVDGLAPGLGETSWRTGDVPFLADKKNRIQKFFYRPLKGVITHFFRQPAFKNYLVYTPEKHYNAKGDRIYSDFYTADFFNDEHSKLPPGCTLVPILFASDSTKLADQVGDHNLWPIYMSIGNLPASIRSRPSTNSWILVATLPIPPKQDLQQMQTYLDEDGVEHTHTKSYMEEKYKALKDDAMHNVISILLKDLDRFYERGLRLDCADGKIRNGRPVLAGWIADYQEYNKLCQIKSHGCAVCEIDYKRLGDNILGNPRNHEEDAKRISRLYNKRREALALPNKKGTKAQLARDKKAIAGEIKALERDISRRQLRVRDSSFWHLKNFSLKSLWKPDILHTLYEGMVKHLIQLVTDFLTHHGRLAEFEAAWIRIPPFQDMPAMKRAIGQNTQTTGKLLRKVVRCILPSLVIALKEPPLDKEEDFRRCLTCVRYLVDFVLVCQYKYHTESTIGLLDEYLAGFHKYKDVFSPFRNEESRKNAGQKKFNEVFLQLTVDFARKRGIKVAVKDVNKADEALKPAPTRVEKNSGRKPARGGKAAGSRSSGRGGAKCSANAGKRGTAGSVGAQNGQTDEDTSDNSWSLEDISTLDPKIQNWMRQEFSARGISEEVWDTQIVDVGDFIRTVAEDEREKAMETGGHFNFIKIHLMSHFSDTVRQFGSLEQFSTEIGETLHKLPKEAYRRSNKHEHVPQILVYCTRKYVIRMKELNLVQLAKDGFWQTEIQDALHLYASRADRRQAAKLGRDGKGALSLYRLSREAANESDRTDDDADVEDEISDTEREREIQDDPIRMPPVVPLFAPDVVAEENIHPLFSKPLSTARGRRFFSGRVTGKRMNLEQVAALFEAPTLVEGVRRHLIERHVEYSGFNRAEFGAFRVEVRTAVNIRTRTVQSLEPYETLKARCTGKGTVGTRFGPRNDAVLYRADYLESDDEDAGPEELSAATLTCFKSLSVGKLLSLFRIKLPRITDITTYKTAVGNLPEEMFRYYRLAFLRVLEPIYAGPQGEMLPGPEIARFGLRKPDQLSGFRVVDIKTMVRPAHLIPEHSDDEKDEKKMRWVFNNRIDHGTWDLIYGGSHEGDDEDMMDVS